MAQQTLRAVDFSFKSFFATVGKVKSARPPRYRKKGGLFTLIIPSANVIIRDGYLTIPQSKTYSSVLNSHKIRIKIPPQLLGKKIREVKIIPLYKGHAFKIAYCYEVDEENLKLNQENALAIDIGSDNLATCVTTFGTSFIVDGRYLKSINRLWNKRRAYLQSKLTKGKLKPSGDSLGAASAPPAGIAPVNFSTFEDAEDGRKLESINRNWNKRRAELQSRLPQDRRSSKLLERLTLKRNNRVNDFIKKTARYIVNFCIANDIGTVVVGHNPDFKRGINLGKKINQQFTQIPFGALRRQLKTLCARRGISHIEQEESFTSKASFLDGDEIPIYDAATPHTGTFSGKRIKRGLYRSKSGRLINADVNGAANILRKSKQKFNFERLCRGLLDSPLRIRVA